MSFLVLSVFTLLTSAALAAPFPSSKVTNLPNRIAFWDFQEEAGQDRVSGNLRLTEQRGPIKRVEDGIFGKYSAELNGKQWFLIPRDKLGPLNIHGKEAQVTVIAWVKRRTTSYWQAIAGVWGETRKKRQYAIFLDGTSAADSSTMTRKRIRNRVHGHVSDVGGPTASEKFCITYSTGATSIKPGQWVCIAMSYDGQASRVYVNGKLDSLQHCNPFPHPNGLFDGGEDGEGFTVGAVDRSEEWGNFFGGRIGGLAVYSRALTPEELKPLAEKTVFAKAD